MSDVISNSTPAATSENQNMDALAGKAALTEAIRHVDIVHISLLGMAAIVLVLLAAVALPVFGYTPVGQIWAFMVMVAAAVAGIAYLYYVNYRVHQHVSNQARLTEVLVNSLGQGFLSFNSSSVCGPVYSQACLDLLETVPAGKNVMDVLRVPTDQHGDFKDWLDIMFMPNHALGFDDVVKFLPSFYPHSKGHRISLMYRPITGKDNLLRQVVVIATDQTEEYAAGQRIEQQRNYADMICRIFKERNQFLATITHIRKFITETAQPTRREDSASLLRSLHTLKAAVKHFHLDKFSIIIHTLESDLRSSALTSEDAFQKRLRQGHKEVEDGLAAVLEQVKDLIGQDYEGRGNMHEVEESALYDFAQEMENKYADPELIRRFLSTLAAVPANDCFRLFERELHDLAEITGKQIKPIRYTGTNPRVLTRPIQDFLFSLTHVCRNIVDHGIEAPVTRLARGKDPAGQVSIHVNVVPDDDYKSEWLHIVISDDGNGIDPSHIRAKLANTDPLGSWRHEDDQTVIQRIFSWGFSTHENITDLSGRGVGMEAVQREVQLLGGSIQVFSELYRGTKLDIRIPYTLDLRRKTLPLILAAKG
ncbi:MAG: ATP-binding protein [Alphaproteobacteria bacterium]|nr:ATP-binding protein [Alphaproteobacteria bacterium]